LCQRLEELLRCDEEVRDALLDLVELLLWLRGVMVNPAVREVAAGRLTFCRRDPDERTEPEDGLVPLSAVCSLAMMEESRLRERLSSDLKLIPESVAWDRLCCDCLYDCELCMAWVVRRALPGDNCGVVHSVRATFTFNARSIWPAWIAAQAELGLLII
jgi:hypothetical protein